MHWASTHLFDQTFDETFALLEETRHHVDMVAHGGLDGVPQDQMLRTVRDLSYLTSQVTGMMSLLMLYRSAANGELDDNGFQACVSTLGQELEQTGQTLAQDCLTSGGDHLPPTLLTLVERGDRLRHRIYSLQGMEQAIHS